MYWEKKLNFVDFIMQIASICFFSFLLACLSGYYGENCVGECSKFCRNNSACEPISGNCPTGCSDGYLGANCSQSKNKDTSHIQWRKREGHKKNNTKLVIIFNLIKIRLGNSLLWHMLITELRIVEEKIYDCECSCIYFKLPIFTLVYASTLWFLCMAGYLLGRFLWQFVRVVLMGWIVWITAAETVGARLVII